MTDKTTATTTTMTTRRRRTETTQSSVKLLKEDDNDDGNTNRSTNTNDVKYENNNDYPNNSNCNGNGNDNGNSNSNSNFFHDWGQGNWCWERDYKRYPVVSFPNYHCHDDDGSNNNDININIDDDDERKPAAIKSSSSIDSDRVTTTASSEMDMTTTKREETRKISIRRRNSQIKVENKNEENHTNDDINSSVNNSNNENNDNDDDNDDSSFYDDWVEGNWCLLNKYKNNNNNKNSNDDGDTSRGTTCTQNNNSNNESSKQRRKRSRDDDNKEDEEIYNEEEDYDEENKDGNDNDDGDDGFLPEDNDDVRNHQKGRRPATKDSKRAAYNGKHQDQIWMEMFEKLVAYKKLHKNTLVTRQYNEDPKFGRWVQTQRQNCKNDDILPNRLALLNSIYFSWKGAKATRQQMAWMKMYQKIVDYKKLHKNTFVPIHYEDNPKLGHWVSRQRQNYKNDDILPNRLALLNSIYFRWVEPRGGKVDNEKWMGMFQKLVAYKDMHKNCMVPLRYQEDPKLGRWVSQQRQYYKNEELLPKRVDLLKSIDFEWVWIDSVKRKKMSG